MKNIDQIPKFALQSAVENSKDLNKDLKLFIIDENDKAHPVHDAAPIKSLKTANDLKLALYKYQEQLLGAHKTAVEKRNAKNQKTLKETDTEMYLNIFKTIKRVETEDGHTEYECTVSDEYSQHAQIITEVLNEIEQYERKFGQRLEKNFKKVG